MLVPDEDLIVNSTSVVTLVCIGGCTGHHDGTQVEDEDEKERRKKKVKVVMNMFYESALK